MWPEYSELCSLTEHNRFNETKEVIVGCYHILTEDLTDAIAIAKDNPEFEYGTTARIEVRPIKMKEEGTAMSTLNKRQLVTAPRL